MRLALLTTCLEPGKDGVGDYTRDLGAACIRLGHSCRLVALNDRYIDSVREERQSARDTPLETLRLPASSSWLERQQAARAWLDRETIDWLSLQFVPYGFHQKGLVTGLGERLAPFIAGRRVHLMFHELWIGQQRGASLRHRLVGWAQRRAVLALVKQLSPLVIHTSNPTYQALAAESGMHAKQLPLCGSIPMAASTDAHWLERECARLGVSTGHLAPRENCWWFGMFGSLHPEWVPEPLFTHIAQAAERARRGVAILSIGRQGPGASLWREIEARYSPRFGFANLGERSRPDVSAYLQSIDFGLATTPWQLIGKSATAAAMLDHGLPVIVSRDDIHLRLATVPNAPAEPLLYLMDSRMPQWLASASPRRRGDDRLGLMAQTFLADLDSAVTPSSASQPSYAVASVSTAPVHLSR